MYTFVLRQWRSRCAGLTGLIFFFLAGIARGQPAPPLDTITRAWQARQERIRTAKVSWVAQDTQPKGIISDELQRMPNGDQFLRDQGITPGSVVPPRDTTFEVSESISIDGRNVRYERADQQWSAKANGYVPMPEITVFQGNVWTRLLVSGLAFNTRPIATHSPSCPINASFPIGAIVTALRPMDKDLRIIRLEAMRPTGRSAIIAGSSCLELRAERLASVTHVWVDRKRDFALVRYLETLGERTCTRLDVHYGNKDHGEWIPQTWESTIFSANGKVERTSRAKVTLVEINQDLPRNEFTLTYRAGTVVHDRTKPGRTTHGVVSEGGEILAASQREIGELNRLTRETGSLSTGSRKWTGTLGARYWAVPVVIMSAGWFLWRGLRARSSNRSRSATSGVSDSELSQ